jgi:hypothetical protein
MSARDCKAGERCSCGLDDALRSKCELAIDGTKPEKVFGLLFFHKLQKPLIEKHCFGDCGKISMAGFIMDDTVGGFCVCCETVCPYLEKEMLDEPYGTTMSFGRPHEVYIRMLKDTKA